MASKEDFNKVIDFAVKDERFRRMLVKDPVQAAKAAGVDLWYSEGEEILRCGADKAGLEKARRK